jgi:hypothetical protein
MCRKAEAVGGIISMSTDSEMSYYICLKSKHFDPNL